MKKILRVLVAVGAILGFSAYSASAKITVFRGTEAFDYYEIPTGQIEIERTGQWPPQRYIVDEKSREMVRIEYPKSEPEKKLTKEVEPTKSLNAEDAERRYIKPLGRKNLLQRVGNDPLRNVGEKIDNADGKLSVGRDSYEVRTKAVKKEDEDEIYNRDTPEKEEKYNLDRLINRRIKEQVNHEVREARDLKDCEFYEVFRDGDKAMGVKFNEKAQRYVVVYREGDNEKYKGFISTKKGEAIVREYTLRRFNESQLERRAEDSMARTKVWLKAITLDVPNTARVLLMG